MSREDMWPEQKPADTQPKQGELRKQLHVVMRDTFHTLGSDEQKRDTGFRTHIIQTAEIEAMKLVDSSNLALLERLEKQQFDSLHVADVENKKLYSNETEKAIPMAALQQEKDAIIGKASTQPTADAQS